MTSNSRPADDLTVLAAEDDADDRFLLAEAFAASGLPGAIRFVTDGEELMDYLLHQGKYAETSTSPRPAVILLDLNMPRKDGRAALTEIKQNPQLKELPIIVLTTSDSQGDKDYCLMLGVADYMIKPSSFKDFIDIFEKAKTLKNANG